MHDARKTLDNEIVLFHDTKVDRMTNDHGKADHKTLEELKRLKVNKKYADKAKASLLFVYSVNDKDVMITSLGTSGVINKAIQMVN